MTRRRRSAKVRIKAGAQRTPTAMTSATAQARRGALLTAVRQGSPLAVLTLLSELEVEGHITKDESIVADEVEEIDLNSALDSEVSLADEDRGELDAPYFSPVTLASDSCVLGGNPLTPRTSADLDSAFEIAVHGDECSLVIPEWAVRESRTSLGRQVLHELDTRIGTLRALSVWLSTERSEFLESRDFWTLGCRGLSEVREGIAPVLQKSLLKSLGIAANVSESSFSRYIRHSRLVWSEGTAPIQILFSREARLAWVAHTVVLFAREHGENLTRGVLNEHGNIPTPKSKAERIALLRCPVDSLDFPSFIRLVALRAGVSWSDVVAAFGERMRET